MSKTGYIDNTDFVLLDENVKDKPVGICIETSEQRLLKQYAVKDALSLAFSVIEFCVLAASKSENTDSQTPEPEEKKFIGLGVDQIYRGKAISFSKSNLSKPFSREELIFLRERAIACSKSQLSSVSVKAFTDLAFAADVLDAMIARTQANINNNE